MPEANTAHDLYLRSLEQRVKSSGLPDNVSVNQGIAPAAIAESAALGEDALAAIEARIRAAGLPEGVTVNRGPEHETSPAPDVVRYDRTLGDGEVSHVEVQTPEAHAAAVKEPMVTSDRPLREGGTSPVEGLPPRITLEDLAQPPKRSRKADQAQ